MITNLWTLTSAATLTALFVASFTVASAEPPAKAIGEFAEDDGTYAIEIVTSDEACRALCKADSQTCRGTVIYQPDTSKPEIQCRLNNGFGANAAFPRVPPEPVDFEKALADLNAYRVSKNVQTLIYDERLNRASEVHARDLAAAGIISHTGTDGSGHGDRIQRQGYYFSIAGENVATGQMSWDAVFQAWKDSPGHNENMLRDDVTEFGLALVYEPTTTYSTYWAMLVADPIDINGSESQN
jgi:uncharacterized protein YkwD